MALGGARTAQEAAVTVTESPVFGNGRPSLKLCKARSRLYRRRFSRINTRWRALDAIYKFHISNTKYSSRDRNFQIFANKPDIFRPIF